MSVRLSVGSPPSFVARVFALSSLVALLAGSEALRGVLSAAVPPAGGGAALLESSFLAEIGSLLSAWLVPVWLLTAACAFVVSLDSAREFAPTSALLGELGGGDRARSAVLLTRTAVLASVSLALGVSLGVVASQVVLRGALVLLGAPYYVPALSAWSLAVTAALALSALLLGSAASMAFGNRRER